MRVRSALLLAGSLAGLVAAPAPGAAARMLTVTYSGSGSWATTFHATPPNPGGAPDTNDAHDASTQRWSLRFRRPLRIPGCAGRARCPAAKSVAGVSGARGATSASGAIDHRHVDGLYHELDASESCELDARTPKGAALAARIDVRYRPRMRAFAIVAREPVADVLAALPGACPEHTDGIDRILDNYFTPGFSFAEGWGPARWFVSRTVFVPAGDLLRRPRLRLRLGPAAASVPPAGCAVAHPEYERCRTGGRWSGTLTLAAAGR